MSNAIRDVLKETYPYFLSLTVCLTSLGFPGFLGFPRFDGFPYLPFSVADVTFSVSLFGVEAVEAPLLSVVFVLRMQKLSFVNKTLRTYLRRIFRQSSQFTDVIVMGSV